MKIRVPKFRFTRKNIYYICIVLWIFISVFFSRTTIVEVFSASNIINSYGSYLIAGILAILVIQDKYGKKIFLTAAVLAFIIIISTFFSSINAFIGLFLFCLTSKYGEQKGIVKCYFVAHLCIMLLTGFLSFIGVISANTMYRGIIIRNSYGFYHPNTFAMEISILLFCYFYLRWEKIRAADYMLWSAILIWSYVNADSRTGFVLSVVFLLLTLAFKNKKTAASIKILYYVNNITLIVTVFVSLYFAIYFKNDNGWMSMLDLFLSYRLSIMTRVYSVYGISLFGQSIANAGVDNSFLTLIVFNGVIIFALFIILLVLCIRIFYKNQDMIASIIMIPIILYGFCENNLWRVDYNFLLVLAVNYYLLSADNGFKFKMQNKMNRYAK